MTHRPSFTQAIYRTTGVAAYDGNPLIEALPPIISVAETASMVEWLPPVPENSDRSAPAELRIHALPSIRKLVYLLPEYGLYSSVFSVVLREGYTTRNPVHAETWQHLHYVNNGGRQDYGAPAPRAHRSSGILFSGISGTGKSTFVNRLLQLYPQVIQHSRYSEQQFIHPQLVWIKIDCPHNGSLSGLALRFFSAVDKALGTSYARSNFSQNSRAPKLAVLLEEMAAVAANHFLGVLIIDELQNLSRAKTQGDEGFLTFLSSMVEQIGVPIIGIGTPGVTKVFRKTLQDARRAAAMGYYEFQRFSVDEDAWVDFVDTVTRYNWTESLIPDDATFRAALYHHTQGITAIVIALFILAQFRCLASGEPMTVETLESVSVAELAPLQAALRVLRSGSAEGIHEFDDLATDRAWAEAVDNLDRAVLDFVALERPRARTRNTANKTTLKKGKSRASTDPQDFRSLETTRNLHDQVRERGLTPVNVFAMGKDIESP
ncbi:ATP-binding protein [Pandoraea sp. NPDC090278]|uniref:ATP-binding protein n=1 Tax=Pandoraea sp. NPDC090278 TaxID=3364391 RepID=UPI00383A0666